MQTLTSNPATPRSVNFAYVAMLAGAFVLFGVTYVFNHMDDDQRSLVAAAQQADYYGSFPFNLGEVWYNRGLLHRAANYLLYKSTLIFCRYDDKTVFEPIYMLQCLIWYAVGLFVVCRASRNALATFGVTWQKVLAISLFAFITVSNQVIFQAEEFGIWLLLLFIILGMRSWRWAIITACMASTTLFWVKGVTVMYIPMHLVAMCWWHNLKINKVCLLAGVALAAFVASLALGWLLFPHEIPNLILTSRVEGNFDFHWTARIIIVIKTMLRQSWHAPAIIIGAVVFLYVMVEAALKKEHWRVFFLLTLLLCPASIVLLQGKGYSYHLAGLLVLAVFAIIYADLLAMNLRLPRFVRTAAIAQALGLAAICTTPFHGFGVYKPLDASYTIAMENSVKEIKRKYNITPDTRMLYLSVGDMVYWFGAKSHMRDYGAFKLQRTEGRLAPHWQPVPDRDYGAYKLQVNKRQENAYYQNYLSEVLKFDGDFVMLDSVWFDLRAHDRLRDKIAAEYTLVEEFPAATGRYYLYQRK